MRPSLPPIALLLVASCTAEDAVTFRVIDELKLAPPECLGAVAQPRDDVTLFDIGFDEASANSAAAILRLDLAAADAVDAALIVTTAESTMRGALDGVPRRLGVSNAAVNEAGQPPRDRVFVTLIAREDAVVLQGDADVRATVQSADDRMRVEVDVVLEGFVSGTGPDTNEVDRLPPPGGPHGAVRSPPFTVPVDLCAGCLVPQCAEGETLVPADVGVCFPGQDEAFACRSE
jgi:hypothetical protein